MTNVNGTVTQKSKKNKVPPEGGWGWMVLVSLAVGNIMVLPTMQFFSYLFYFISVDMHLSMFQSGSILILNGSCQMLLNSFIKKLLKRFSLRKLAFIGAVLAVSGFVGSALSQSFWEMLLAFSFVLAIGVKLYLSSCIECAERYFVKRRDVVKKFNTISVGFGFIIVPLIMWNLLETFSARNTVLILGACSSVSMFAAFLLQPVEGHLKEVEEDIEVELVDMKNGKTKENVLSEEKLLPKSTETPVNNSGNYSQNIQIGSSNNALKKDNEMYQLVPQTDVSTPTPPKTIVHPYRTLLLTPRFMLLTIGVTFNAIAEAVFSAFLAFLLFQYNIFPNSEIAISISFFAGTLISMKYLGLFWKSRFMPSPRVTGILCIIVLIASRIGIAMGFMNCFLNLTLAGIIIGAGKGMLQSKVEDIVPEIISDELVDQADVIQSISNSIGFFIGGPLLGYFRDLTGNFGLTMFGINLLNSVVIIIWTGDLMISIAKECIRLRRTPETVVASPIDVV